MPHQRSPRSAKQLAASLETAEEAFHGYDRGNTLKRQNGKNATLAEALHGDIDAPNLLKYEKPIHRTMVNMLAAGYTVAEISKATGYCVNTVSNAVKQPHARQYLIQEAKKSVQQEIKAILEQEAIPSLQVLTAVRDNPNARTADRTAAANSLLDRFLGKAAQPIVTTEKPIETLTDDELRARANSILSRFGDTQRA